MTRHGTSLTTNNLHLLLASLNVITLWYLGVLAMGLARLGRASFVRAALWVYGVWAITRAVVILGGWGTQGL